MYIFLSHVFSTSLCQQQADRQRQNSGTFEGKKPKKKIKKYILKKKITCFLFSTVLHEQQANRQRHMSSTL